jgi:hypothetical protein
MFPFWIDPQLTFLPQLLALLASTVWLLVAFVTGHRAGA